jgi:hypothetical protein
MSSTKRLRRKGNEHTPDQARQGATRKRWLPADWMKKCAAFVGLLGACAGLLFAILGQPSQWFERPNTEFSPDPVFEIVNVDGVQFEFRLPLTLVNKGHKLDTIRRPLVTFTSNMPAVNCTRDAVFKETDRDKDMNFPLILKQEASVQLTCIIKWEPPPDYDQSVSKPAGTQETDSPAMGLIKMTWPGGEYKPIEWPFLLVPGEWIRGKKPSESVKVYIPRDADGTSPEGGDSATLNTASSTFVFGLQNLSYGAADIEMGGASPIATTAMQTSTVQATKTHYAVQGEVASGKEVSPPNAGELIVNVRPCGGAAELVVFRAQFRKRAVGSLPCGVQVVQAEKL